MNGHDVTPSIPPSDGQTAAEGEVVQLCSELIRIESVIAYSSSPIPHRPFLPPGRFGQSTTDPVGWTRRIE